MTGLPLISPIRHAQISSAAQVMASAFANAPRYTFLLPDDAERRAKLPWVWEAAIRACIYSRGVVHVAHDGSGRAMSGVAIWAPPHRGRRGVLAPLRVRPVGCARPARHPGLAAAARLEPVNRLHKAAQPILVSEWHRRRPFGAAHGPRQYAHQPHASAHRRCRPARLPRYVRAA